MKSEGPASPPRPPYLALFLLCIFTYFYFYPSGQHNDNARFDQTRAIVEHGELHIDRFSGNTADVVFKQVPIYPEGTPLWAFLPWREPPKPIREVRHVFPNKAPGTSFFAVPAWWALNKFFSMFQFPRWIVEHLIPWLTIWLSIGLMSALAALCLYGVLEHMLRSGPVALTLTAAWALGSIAFPFSIVNFSHQFAASMLFIAFAIVYCYKENTRLRVNGPEGEPPCALPFNSPLWLGLAGFLAGFSLTTEYPTALAVGPLCLYALVVIVMLPGRRWRWLPLFAAGVIAGGMFLVWYNIKIDGKIFYIPYQEYASGEMKTFQEHKQGFMGVTFFKDKETSAMMIENLKHITYRPQRGLFYCNPWTALVLPGLVAWVLWRRRRLEGLLCAVIVVAFFIFNAGYGKTIVFWGGGWSVGPRHIIPMLPFLTVLVAAVARWLPMRMILYPLVLVSMGIMLMASAVEPRAPYEYRDPVRDLFFENYQIGRLAYYDMGVFNSRFITHDSVAFNVGKLIRLKSEYQLLPLFAFWSWMGWLILGRIRRRHAALRENAVAASLESTQKDLNPQTELMEYMEDVVLRQGSEVEAQPEISPMASPNPDPPASPEPMEPPVPPDDLDSSAPADETDLSTTGTAPHAFPPPAAPSPVSTVLPKIMAWLRRLNDPSRLVYARFFWPVMYGGFIAFMIVMFMIPFAYSRQQEMKMAKGQGLKGQYVRGLVWKAKPDRTYKAPEIEQRNVAFERLDEVINYDWINSGLPIQGQFTIIWSGWLYVPEDGPRTFATESDDGSMLFINNRMVVDNWGSHHPTQAIGRVTLTKGFHPITLVYYNDMFGGLIRLKWAGSAATLTTITSDFLFVERPSSGKPAP